MNIFKCKTKIHSKIPGCELAPAILFDKYSKYLYSLDNTLSFFQLDLTKNDNSFDTYKSRIADSNRNIFIGGDHSTTALIYNLLKNEKMKIIIFDAHNDFDSRVENMKCTKLANWNIINFLLKHNVDILVLGTRFVHKNMMESNRVQYIDHTQFNFISKALNDIRNFLGDCKKLYISIDLDVLNPIEFPSVSYPVPGGLFYRELLYIIEHLLNSVPYCVFDLVEYNPVIGSNNSEKILLSILEKIITYRS